MKTMLFLWCVAFTILINSSVRAQFSLGPTCVRSCMKAPTSANCNDSTDCICQSVDWDAVSSCLCSSCGSSQQKALVSITQICGSQVDLSSTCPTTSSSSSKSTTKTHSTTSTSSTKTSTSTTTDTTTTASETSTSTSTATNTAAPQSNDQGLSSGTKVGIAVGSVAGAAALLFGLIFFFARHLRKSREEYEESKALRTSQARLTWADARAELGDANQNPFSERHEVTEYVAYSDTSIRRPGMTETGVTPLLTSDDGPRGSWLARPPSGYTSPPLR